VTEFHMRDAVYALPRTCWSSKNPFTSLESALMRLFNSHLRCVHDLCTGAAAVGGQEKEEERWGRGWEKGQKEEIKHALSVVWCVLKCAAKAIVGGSRVSGDDVIATVVFRIL
jgi:hypothetical protein